MARDYYGLLGVSKGASDSELKRAYRKLARELHPDVNPDEAAQARFTEIQLAYEVLSDPEKRRIVDLGGDPLEGAGAGGGGFSGAGFGGLGDVFEAFFGGGAGSRGPIGRVRPGSDSLLRMRLDLTECATGVTKQVAVDTAVLCDLCQGKGTHGNSVPKTCDTCKGHGEVQTVQRSLLGQVMTHARARSAAASARSSPIRVTAAAATAGCRPAARSASRSPQVSATVCGYASPPRARSAPVAALPVTSTSRCTNSPTRSSSAMAMICIARSRCRCSTPRWAPR